MHCPQCGTRIESDQLSYCTRCGQMLDRVRVAMSEELTVARGTKVSRSGLNFGVGLMYFGLWPALLVLLLSSSAIPLSFLMLTGALAAIVFGSGPLLRIFQTDEIHPEVERARRKEIAFGSMLMYVAAIVGTLLVAVAVPDYYVRGMLIGVITLLWMIMLKVSKPLYSMYRDLASNDPLMLKPKSATPELTTSTLDPASVEFRMPARGATTAELIPPSVTEGTTELLDKKADVE